MVAARALTLSETGVAALGAAVSTATRTEQAALSAVEPDDLRAVHRAMRSLLSALADG
ncbi:hypothetical protein CLV70_101598 [Pseudosporangium ferrugineum]|uniref:MarR family transcriptional regulator n=1 Tax=Pseudosporangium ferrugineum TaxID=439699 RepID=A0A2T0SJ47_9ACTN|nr:hypothetical protein CLV70_101598 [Pseudosporangium ferrugineum]